MQSQTAYTPSQKTASISPVSDVWTLEELGEFTTPEVMTDAKYWMEAIGDHLGDMFDDMLQESAEQSEFVRYGSAGGF